MTLGDRVCVLRKGVIQQVASPRELYEQPVNLFVAGFIGSPPMNFLPGDGRGQHARDAVRRHRARRPRARKAARASDLVLVGIRPEYFEDASLVDEAKRAAGLDVPARVDVTEWLGDSQYAYIPFEAPEEVTAQLRELARELDSEQLRTQAIVSIDATSRIREGREAEFWLDTPQGARVRPADRRQPHPRRRGRRRADPHGHGGPGGAGGGCAAGVDEATARRDRGRRCLRAAATGAGPPRSPALPADDRGGAMPSSTRSTCAASPTPTATASATSAACAARLPYLADLGVDAVWITPWYPSPMADGGYDVADYRDIDPLFGTLADADALLAEAHALGLRVIIDLVANHTSDAAPVVRGRAGRRARVARSGTGTSSATAGPAGSEPPNDWISAFGGRGLDPRASSRTAARGSGTCTCSPPSSPTSTGSTPASATSSTRSCGSGSTAGSTASGSTPRPAMAKAPGLPDAGHAPGCVVRVADLGGQPALGRRRGARHPAALAPDRGLLRRRPAVRRPRRWSTAPSGSAATCGPTRCTPASTSTTSPRPWDAARAARGRRRRPWPRWNRSAPRPPGCCPATTRPATSPASAGPYTGAAFGGVAPPGLADRPRPRPAPGPRRRRCSPSPCPAPPTSTRARSSGCPRSRTCPTRCSRTRPGSAPGGTVRGRDGCRVPLPWERRRARPSASRGTACRPWLPQPAVVVGPRPRPPAGRPGSTLVPLPRRAAAATAACRAPPMTWRTRRRADGVLAFDRGPSFRCVVNLRAGPVDLTGQGRVLLASAPVRSGLPPDTAVWLRPGRARRRVTRAGPPAPLSSSA